MSRSPDCSRRAWWCTRPIRRPTAGGGGGAWLSGKGLGGRARGGAGAPAPADAPRPSRFGEPALALRKAAHHALARVSEDIDRLRFNVCVAHIYEFANAFQASLV